MSNFHCDECGAECIDSPKGYVTGCKHYPPDTQPAPVYECFICGKNHEGECAIWGQALTDLNR